jgi:two-component system, chemotaxis family, chemotaxis protein CheY
MKAVIVDDEAIARTALRDALSAQGKLRFEEFEDGNAAWKALDEGLAPAICLFDVRMPGKDGIELLRHMRTDPRFSGIPVMLVTASAARDVVVKASALGIDGLVVKPIERRLVGSRVFPILQQFIDNLLAPPGRVRQKLGIDANKYGATMDILLNKAQETVKALQGEDSDSTRKAMANLASMRTTAGALGAAHFDAALGRSLSGLDLASDAKKRGQSAGILEVGLSLLRDGMEWQGLTVSA